LPPTAEREHYREDLLGFAVVNLEGQSLGTLEHFVDGAQALMSLKSGDRQMLIPAAPPFLRRVQMQDRRVVVDWPSDF
jgi:ribosomal 30S subunit maturation factor RimM